MKAIGEKFFIMPKLSSEKNVPFFIIGSPRSGTTLLRLMLSHHPGLIIPPECGFVLWLKNRFSNWDKRHSENPGKRREFAKAVSSSRKFETWGVDSSEITAAILRFQPESYAGACACVYRIFSEKFDKPNAVWGDKNNYYLAKIDELVNLYPKAKFIHIIRDGRDVACSYREIMSMSIQSKYRPFLPTDMKKIAEAWRGDITCIHEQLARVRKEQSIEVRYEDLTDNTEFELTRLCNFLGFEFENDMLDFHQPKVGSPTEPVETIDWKRRTAEPISPATVGRFRNILTSHEISVFEALARDELRLYGYELLKL